MVYGLAPRHGPCFELHAGLVVAASVLVSELPLRVVESSLVRVGVGRIRRAGRGMQQGKPAGGPAGRQGRKGRYIRLVESHHQPCPASRPGASPIAQQGDMDERGRPQEAGCQPRHSNRLASWPC